MKDITISGLLQFGIQRDGVWHKEFTMRVPTLEDVECRGLTASDGGTVRAINCTKNKWWIRIEGQVHAN